MRDSFSQLSWVSFVKTLLYKQCSANIGQHNDNSSSLHTDVTRVRKLKGNVRCITSDLRCTCSCKQSTCLPDDVTALLLPATTTTMWCGLLSISQWIHTTTLPAVNHIMSLEAATAARYLSYSHFKRNSNQYVTLLQYTHWATIRTDCITNRQISSLTILLHIRHTVTPAVIASCFYFIVLY